MLTVGLTGGIGAGKSEVSRLLASYGAIIVDADLAAREVVAAGTPGLAAVVEEFGPEVLRADGELDRERVASIVFADADALARLNAIVHPLVGVRMRELAAAAGEDDVLVYDVPLLTENHLSSAYDVVVVVDAPEETQVARLVESRGMTDADARARIAAQASRADRLAIADIVIDNGGTREELAARVADVWADLSTRPPSPR